MAAVGGSPKESPTHHQGEEGGQGVENAGRSALDAGLGDRKEQGGNPVPNQTDHRKPGQQAPMVPTHMPEPEGDHGQTGHANAHGCQFERWKGRQNALHKDKR